VPRVFKDSKDISDDKWINIVAALCELGMEELTISGGGEPCLRADLLIEILKITKRNNVKTGIISNGSLVNEDLARRIVEVAPDEWRSSICSPFRASDGLLRGRDLLSQSFDGIAHMAAWKKKMGNGLPKLEVWMLQTQFNIEHITDMIKKAASIGADSVSLRMVNPPTNKELYPTEEQRTEMMDKIEDYEALSEALGIEFRRHFSPEDILPFQGGAPSQTEAPCQRQDEEEAPPAPTERVVCMLPFREIVVFADGRVSPCCNFIMHGEDSEAIGNALKEELKDIWLTNKFTRFRENMMMKVLPERCRECTPDFKSIDREYREFRES